MTTNRREAFSAILGICGSARAVGWVALASAVSLGVAAVVRFLAPTTPELREKSFLAGRLADFPIGHVETKYRRRHGVWIVRGDDCGGKPNVFALRGVCTHLGCLTDWDAERRRFCCPCHGSEFAVDGRVVAGPAPRPLDRCEVRIRDDGTMEIFYS